MAGLGAEYYLETSAWADVHPSQMLGPPCLVKSYDLLTVQIPEVAAPLQVLRALLPVPVCPSSVEEL